MPRTSHERESQLPQPISLTEETPETESTPDNLIHLPILTRWIDKPYTAFDMALGMCISGMVVALLIGVAIMIYNPVAENILGTFTDARGTVPLPQMPDPGPLPNA